MSCMDDVFGKDSAVTTEGKATSTDTTPVAGYLVLC